MATFRIGTTEYSLFDFKSKAEIEGVFRTFGGSANLFPIYDTLADILWAIRNAQASPVAPIVLVEVDPSSTQEELLSVTDSISELIERNPAKYGYLSEAIITNVPIKIRTVTGEVVSKSYNPDDHQVEVVVKRPRSGRLAAILDPKEGK